MRAARERRRRRARRGARGQRVGVGRLARGVRRRALAFTGAAGAFGRLAERRPGTAAVPGARP
ncbi:hypothetical protein WL77_09460 [Burkholderia ubonensis]|nr:hypothetical protein WL77_09460 [Burkholderia ubonensis]KWE72284.1 hypothetical protein WL79_00465 [Burkholderia ubonensis]